MMIVTGACPEGSRVQVEVKDGRITCRVEDPGGG